MYVFFDISLLRPILRNALFDIFYGNNKKRKLLTRYSVKGKATFTMPLNGVPFKKKFANAIALI